MYAIRSYYAIKDISMKNSLGKRLLYLFIFFSITLLYSEGFDYNITVNKTNPFIKEPVILTVDIKQTDTSKVMLFKFDPVKSTDYRSIRLEAKEKDIYQNRNNFV